LVIATDHAIDPLSLCCSIDRRYVEYYEAIIELIKIQILTEFSQQNHEMSSFITRESPRIFVEARITCRFNYTKSTSAREFFWRTLNHTTRDVENNLENNSALFAAMHLTRFHTKELGVCERFSC